MDILLEDVDYEKLVYLYAFWRNEIQTVNELLDEHVVSDEADYWYLIDELNAGYTHAKEVTQEAEDRLEFNPEDFFGKSLF